MLQEGKLTCEEDHFSIWMSGHVQNSVISLRDGAWEMIQDSSL